MKNLRFVFIALFFVGFIVCPLSAQGTLQFNQVKIINASVETVPAGKVWKIENIYVPQIMRFVASSGSGGCSGSCNGSSTTWNNFTTEFCPSLTVFNSSPQVVINGAPVFFSSDSPIWLPAGSTLSGNTFTCNSTNGWFNGTANSVNYSCHCPVNPNSTATNISVIEFNILP